MKKMKIKSIGIILSFVMTFSFLASCKKDDETNNSGESSHVNSVIQTDTVLCAQGQSNYSILLSDTADEMETFAATELQNFVSEATGVKLPIVYDDEIAVNTTTNATFLSVGINELFKRRGIVLPESLGLRGFVIESIDDCVFMSGASSEGTLCSVYEFLHSQFDFEVYASDTIKITEKSVSYLNKYDVVEIPDIQYPAGDWRELMDDKLTQRRLRLQQYGGSDWVSIGGHNSFLIVSPDTYYATHKDWFSPDKLQLCYSNFEMFETFVDNLMVYVNNSPDATKAMLSLADNTAFCTCDNCLESRRKYGTDSATLIIFYNKIAEELKKRLPDRDITIYFLAYLATLDAPATYNEKTKTYEPNSPDVVMHENVGVIYAPMHNDFRYSLGDKENNPSTKAIFDAWAAMTDNLGVYSYNYYVHDAFIPFNTYNNLQADYKYAVEELGVEIYYYQGLKASPIGSFSNLNSYLQSKLTWDISLNVNDLIADFCNNYFGPAGSNVKAYFDLFMARMTSLQTAGTINGSIYAIPSSASNFPKYFIDECKKHLDAGYALLEPLKNTDVALYEKYYRHMKKEELTLMYLYLGWNYQYFTAAERVAMINEFEYWTREFSIVGFGDYTSDSDSVANLISAWRTRESK